MWELESVLPGRLVMGRGSRRDYEELERFHYRGKRPATWAGVWVVRWVRGSDQGGEERNGEGANRRIGEAGDGGSYPSPRPSPSRGEGEGKVVGVGVLSWPTVSCGAREEVLGIGGMERGERIRFINEQVRTISRVVVHPTFRSLGLASRLVRCMIEHCSTRWVEALAVMGRVHPLFEKAGMRKVEGGRAVYYIHEKEAWGSTDMRFQT